MSKLRSLNTAFWSDTWVEELEPMQKLLFIYLVTNEKTNMLGIYEASVKKISFETGIVPIVVKTYLKDFEKAEKVKYIDNRVILINYMKHQNYNTNMKKSAIDTYNDLPNSLKVKGLDVGKDKPIEGFERLSKAYGMVRKVEVEYEVETKEESEGEGEIKTPTKTNDLTVEVFLNRWKDARMFYDKKPTNITKLNTWELIDFNELKKTYSLKDFEKAMQGLFQQKTLPTVRLRPTHFLKLNYFEQYLTCYSTKEKLFEDKKPFKKPIERI